MIRRDNVPHGDLSIRNDHPDNLIAVLSDSATMRPFQTVAVGSGTEIQVSAPNGHYGLRIMTGRVWCNLAQGFIGGTNAWLNGGVNISGNAPIQAIIGQGARPNEINLAFQNLYRTVEQHSGGLTVRQSPNRSYITPAEVNGRSFEFIIDTGASSTTISAAMAQQAGVSCLRAAQFTLASGRVSGCYGRANELSFGPFKVQNVEVSILPDAQQGLLGMDVLRHFNMAWGADTVRITSMGVAGPIPASQPSRPMASVVQWAGPISAPNTPMPTAAKAAREVFRSFGWLVLVGMVYVLLVMRTKQRNSENARFARDLNRLRTAGGAPAHDALSSAHERRRLLVACGGNMERMERLVEYECRRAPEINESEAVRRALERIERDRQ